MAEAIQNFTVSQPKLLHSNTLYFYHTNKSIFKQMQSEVNEKLKATVCYKTLNFLNIHSLIRTKSHEYGEEERIMMKD